MDDITMTEDSDKPIIDLVRNWLELAKSPKEEDLILQNILHNTGFTDITFENGKCNAVKDNQLYSGITYNINRNHIPIMCEIDLIYEKIENL